MDGYRGSIDLSTVIERRDQAQRSSCVPGPAHVPGAVEWTLGWEMSMLGTKGGDGRERGAFNAWQGMCRRRPRQQDTLASWIRDFQSLGAACHVQQVHGFSLCMEQQRTAAACLHGRGERKTPKRGEKTETKIDEISGFMALPNDAEMT